MRADRSEHAFLGDLHGVVHDLEKDFVFALKVMVEAALAELERGGDVVHGSGVVSALLKQARGGAQDFLPGINRSLRESSRAMVNSSQSTGWRRVLDNLRATLDSDIDRPVGCVGRLASSL